MLYVITFECVNCGECADICPVSAIVKGDGIYVITDACLGDECGKCVSVCPVEAIRGDGR